MPVYHRPLVWSVESVEALPLVDPFACLVLFPRNMGVGQVEAGGGESCRGGRSRGEGLRKRHAADGFSGHDNRASRKVWLGDSWACLALLCPVISLTPHRQMRRRRTRGGGEGKP